MGVLANGFIGASGVFQFTGATVLNNAYPYIRLANFARTGANRNITAGEGITSGLVSLPSGNRHPSAWMMPQKPGALASRNSITGSGALSASALAVKLAAADLTGSGALEAIGGLIVNLIADISGSGEVSDADVKAFLAAVANLTGSGGISDAGASGLGELVCALVGLGTAAGSTATGIGAMSADLVVTGTGLTTGNVGQAVWNRIVEAGFTAEEILRIIAAQAAGAATGLEGTNPQFTGLDGTTIRIDGTYSGGTRSIDNLDGS